MFRKVNDGRLVTQILGKEQEGTEQIIEKLKELFKMTTYKKPAILT